MKNAIARRLLTTVILIFVLMSLMTVYIVSSFYKSSVNNIMELGESNMNSQASMIEQYINKGMDVLWVTADTVDHMIEEDMGNELIARYMAHETKKVSNTVDPNFTGIYGYINGEYIDGSNWGPPSGYVPQERDWYTAAQKAKGATTIVAPYLDAQTQTVMISISRLLSDGESVISLDVALTEIQNITESMTMNDKGYGFIIDKSGLVVAHLDENEKGKTYPENEEQKELVDGIFKNTAGHFSITLDGKNCTVFSKPVANEWYVVVVADNTKLLNELKRQIYFCILVTALVFLLIAAFTAISARKIEKSQAAERKSREKLDKVNMNIIRSLAYTIDAKDRYTSGHSQRVAEYALKIAQRMGKTAEEQKIIYYAGLLHDVGKIRVPENLINKPGKLTESEFDQIRVHPVSGYHILRDIHEDERIGYGAKYHHERYDGTGYPNGLAGANIPEIARILGVADAYDAMASNRSYRNALAQDVVRQEILNGKGRQFDPDVADVMLEMIDEDKEYKMCQRDNEQKNILVVDDEIMNIRTVEKILEDTPLINVLKATNKDETFEALENNDIALILLDLMMPDIDGFALFGMIREKYDTPVVLMTADKSIETINKLTELGMDDYLTKPLNKFITQEMIYAIINFRRNNI
ncbi:MAG: response regulator [Firmicutes bacterium]|nr:response regulator [Bacillota bacterium]MBQ9519741.1 response regulator [Bacillota bacterium]